jgi:hypothetical protein
MGRKLKCNSSSSSSSSCNPCSSSSSSSSYMYCCTKFPKCKCAPIYYPNNCNPNLYPCNPCAPKLCPPYPCPPYPCPPYPCPSYPSSTPYTSNNNQITSNTTFTMSSPNVNICNTSTPITITLPQISTLSGCSYNKMFVISNIFTSTSTVTLSVTPGDNLTNPTLSVLNPGDSITLYSVYNATTGSYWVVA